jgi:small nuclear ribonucleoprotein (snRNP)-like protein
MEDFFEARVNSSCKVKLRKSQLRLVQGTDNVSPPILTDESNKENESIPSKRKVEDDARRKAMNHLIHTMDKGSKAVARSTIATTFKGENQWYSKGPFSLLTRSINKRVNLVMKVGKLKTSKLTGTLLLFDRHFNIILENATLNNTFHKSIFIRGALVVFISCLD